MKNTPIRAALLGALLLTIAPSAFAGDPCRDPWVSEVVKQVKNKLGFQLVGREENGDCNINLYGHDWANKDELRKQVQQTVDALKQAGLAFKGPNGSDANAIDDQTFHETLIASAAYIGPSAKAPKKGSKDGNRFVWHIQLPRGYVLAIARKCPEGSSASPTGACKASGA